MVKIIVLGLLGVLVLWSGALVGGAAYLLSGGIAYAEIDTPDVSMSVPVPVRFADLAFDFGEVAIPEHDLKEMRRETARYAPMISAALESISEDVPDGTVLVSVESPRETVYVARERGRLVVDVDSPDATVRVKVPVRAAHRLAEKLEDFLTG